MIQTPAAKSTASASLNSQGYLLSLPDPLMLTLIYTSIFILLYSVFPFGFHPVKQILTPPFLGLLFPWLLLCNCNTPPHSFDIHHPLSPCLLPHVFNQCRQQTLSLRLHTLCSPPLLCICVCLWLRVYLSASPCLCCRIKEQPTDHDCIVKSAFRKTVTLC